MASYRIQWNPMEFNGILWDSIESYGIQWNPMEFNGILWNPMESNGIQWNPIRFNRILLDSMESYGIQWNPMQSYKILRNPLRSYRIMLFRFSNLCPFGARQCDRDPRDQLPRFWCGHARRELRGEQRRPNRGAHRLCRRQPLRRLGSYLLGSLQRCRRRCRLAPIPGSTPKCRAACNCPVNDACGGYATKGDQGPAGAYVTATSWDLGDDRPDRQVALGVKSFGVCGDAAGRAAHAAHPRRPPAVDPQHARRPRLRPVDVDVVAARAVGPVVDRVPPVRRPGRDLERVHVR
eukprot:gene17836-biopygen10709